MKKKVKVNKLKRAFVIVLGLTLVFGASTALIFNHYMNRISRIDEDEPVIEQDDYEREDNYNPEEYAETDLFEWGEVETFSSPSRYNILLVGQDRRPGEGRTRSDAMILASINPSTGEVNLISFLRDAFVQLPWGYYPDKLNHTYAYGGYDMLSETLTMNYGVQCDGFVEVDFDGFETIVDAVGGVNLYLTAAESAHLAAQGLFTDNGEGYYYMNGYQALQYARIRYLDSDFGRTERQKNVIEAVINQVRGLSIGQLTSLVDSCLPYVSTNMSNTQIISIVTKCAGMLSSGMSISRTSVPQWGEYTEGYASDMYVLWVDREAINQRLKALIGN